MDDYAEYRDAWHPDNTTAFRYGCIRITDGTHDTPAGGFITNPGLYIHNNAAHISVGLKQVHIVESTGYLRVETDGATNGVPIVTGDETAAAQGLLFGASGGNDYIDLKCYKVGVGLLNFGVQANYDVIASANLNLWIAFLSPLVRGG